MTVKPRLEVIFAGISPEGRGALLAGDKATSFYPEVAVEEAKKVMISLQYLKEVEEILVKAGVQLDYQLRLEALVRPLGVPELVDTIKLLDAKEWGIDKLLVGPIEGPYRDLLESLLIRGMTDLGLAEAMSETPATIRKRITRKISPLSRHLKRYDLLLRIHLWVLNVVYGESIRQIAAKLANDPERIGVGYSSDDWVKEQIRDAARILGTKRLTGRPRKGGVLRHWKLMAK